MGSLDVHEWIPSKSVLDGSNLKLRVIYTSPKATKAGLKVASELARDLSATLELLVPQVVPYPRPLNEPTKAGAFTEIFLSRLVSDCAAEVEVKVLLCRDREETIPHFLPSESIAVIGRHGSWGRDAFSGLIRAVRRYGHHVIVVDCDKERSALIPFFKPRIIR